MDYPGIYVPFLSAVRGSGCTNVIGKGAGSAGGTCGTVTIDGVEDPTASSEFTNFNLYISNWNEDGDTWELVNKNSN